jgi:ABC-2 type transport system ATP-binding protein
MELLRIENLSKVIKKKTIVEDLSFVVNSGEIVGFLGPNGAGKTTTIKMITGLFKITEGDVYICGKNITTNFEDAMKNVGGIIENPDLYKNMTGRNNLKYYASMYDGITDEDIEQVVGLVKMSQRIDDKVKTYSLGMRQRIGLAQAILHKPRLLVLDEPTNGLDPLGIKELRDMLKYLSKEAGTGVLVSSHLLSEMELMCDRILVIDDGKMIGEKQIGESEEENHLEGIFSYSFVTNNNEKVYTMFKGLNTTCDMSNNDVSLVMKKKHIPGIIKQIVDKNIDIYSVNQNQRSLEDDFLSMTTGTKNQIN